MIEYIKGELTEVTPTLAVVEAAGVGYGIIFSLTPILQSRKRRK
jgi:Holliday junction DNA helicase RuvA